MLLEAVLPPTGSVMLPSFWKPFEALPPKIKDQAHRAYHRWRSMPMALNFEPKHGNYYVVEFENGFHAICRFEDRVVKWMWIGPYKAYDSKLSSYR